MRDDYMNRGDDGTRPAGLSKLDELALKKAGAKETEAWKRDAAKVGGLRHTKFTYTEHGWDIRKQKCRGVIPDIPGEVIPKKETEA
jgi:hypothetical protein